MFRTAPLRRLRKALESARSDREWVVETLKRVSFQRLSSGTLTVAEDKDAYDQLVETLESAQSRLDQPEVFEHLKLPAPL
jgi:uncharacterized membrane protein YfbV (UPF0208 family)